MVLTQDLLGRETEKIVEVLIQHLWSLLVSGEVDAIVFCNLSEHSLLSRGLLCNGPKWWCEKHPLWTTHWSMEVPEKPGLLLQKLRSNHRRRIQKNKRDLEFSFPGKLSWQWMKTFDDIPALSKQLEGVASKTYHRGLGVGFIDNEEFRQRLRFFASRGTLRVLILAVLGFFRLLDRSGRLIIKKMGRLDQLKTGWRRLLMSSNTEQKME